jgi:hypothetical protein
MLSRIKSLTMVSGLRTAAAFCNGLARRGFRALRAASSGLSPVTLLIWTQPWSPVLSRTRTQLSRRSTCRNLSPSGSLYRTRPSGAALSRRSTSRPLIKKAVADRCRRGFAFGELETVVFRAVRETLPVVVGSDVDIWRAKILVGSVSAIVNGAGLGVAAVRSLRLPRGQAIATRNTPPSKILLAIRILREGGVIGSANILRALGGTLWAKRTALPR